MNMATKHTVLQAHLQKWLACEGDRDKRGALTKELATLLNMHPKSIGRSMRRLQLRRTHTVTRRGRTTYYGKDVDAALEKIWEEMDYPCAENMHSVISEYVTHFTHDRDWNVTDVATSKLCDMSVGTLKLRLRALRKKRGIGRGRSATVASPLKGMIPIRKSHTWHTLGPGHVQTDSVVHCGDRLTDDVIYSVGAVDFATYWSDYTAQWNKGQTATCKSLQTIRTRFPFPFKELHPDTGNEFINYHVYEWATRERIAMTRSEPYKKNDNMCIEERNGSIARKHLGYVRMDDQSVVETVQEVLRLACLLHNHFRPVRRMTSKTRVHAQWKRTFEDSARTPYKRVLARDDVPQPIKDVLRAEHETLNPLQLKRDLDTLKEKLGRTLQANNSRTVR